MSFCWNISTSQKVGCWAKTRSQRITPRERDKLSQKIVLSYQSYFIFSHLGHLKVVTCITFFEEGRRRRKVWSEKQFSICWQARIKIHTLAYTMDNWTEPKLCFKFKIDLFIIKSWKIFSMYTWYIVNYWTWKSRIDNLVYWHKKWKLSPPLLWSFLT